MVEADGQSGEALNREAHFRGNEGDLGVRCGPKKVECMNSSIENQNQENSWNRNGVRSLRLRLGWSQSDLARRLHCEACEVESFENGATPILNEWKQTLELIARQADLCSEELHSTPLCENLMEEKSIEQVDFQDIKLDIQD